jgi:nucleobase:cation symporter-1, NCS1 family
MIVSVSLTLPGLVNSINPKIHVGVGTRLFDIAYLLEVSIYYRFSHGPRLALNLPDLIQITLASVVYYTLSKLFPANDTMLDHAILENDGLSDGRSYSGSEGKRDGTQIDELKVA